MSTKTIDDDSLVKIAARNGSTVEEMSARCAAGKCWRCGGAPYRVTSSGRPVCATCAVTLIRRALLEDGDAPTP